MRIKRFIYAVATLSGTIIGVGLFALPYITVQAGFGLMLFYLIALGGLVILIHLLFSEVALKTPDFLRLPGYARLYLGKWGRTAALVSTIVGSFGALLAYIIIGGGFSKNLLSPLFGGNELFYAVLYFITGSLCVFFGIKAVAKIEFWGMVLFLVSLIMILFRGLPFFKIENLLTGMAVSTNWFLPYGPVLFSLWGATMIPETEEMLGRDKILIKKVVLIATIIPVFIYTFFILLVVGISGINTSQEAISGLKNYLGEGILAVAFLVGIITTFTSFIAIGLTLKKVFWYDAKIPKTVSWAIACFVPLALFLAGFKNFIQVIGFIGAFALAVDGVIILLIYQKIRAGKIKLLTYPLILIFVAGIIYEIVYYFFK